MAAHTASAPFALSTSQIDFTHDAAADPVAIIGFYNLTHKFMTRDSPKSIVSAQQFEIGVADAAQPQAYQGETFGSRRTPDTANLDAAIFKMHSQHEIVHCTRVVKLQENFPENGFFPEELRYHRLQVLSKES
jgi:hypothetical protein